MTSTTGSDSQGRQYPMLESCQVTVVRPRTGGGQCGSADLPPVRLPQDCIDSFNDLIQDNNKLPKLYDFALEHEVLSKKQDRDEELESYRTDSRDELQKNLVSRMQLLTHASEDVCISLLQSTSFDLKTSVETYLSSPSTYNKR